MSGLSHVRTSYGKIVEPTHAGGFELITKLETPVDVSRLTALYRRVRCARPPAAPVALPPPPLTTSLTSAVSPLPAIVLGTMHLKGDKLGACYARLAPTPPLSVWTRPRRTRTRRRSAHRCAPACT